MKIPAPNVSTAPNKSVYDPDRYWNERLEKDFSLAGVGHSSVGLRFNRWAYKVRKKVLMRTLQEFDISLKNEKILELGCGAGANIRFFEELGCEYWGIEGSPTIVARLHSKYPKLVDRIITGDFTH